MPKIDPFKTPDGKPISNAIERWDNLSDRDFAVAGCAVMDANLTHLLQQRLADLPKIAENFLGSLTLSSKAKLAVLVGLITTEDAGYLEAFMRIRNYFAHRVVMDFTTDCVVRELNKLRCLVEETTLDEWRNDPRPGVRELHRTIIDEGTRKIGTTNLADRSVFSWSRVTFEILFWNIDFKNERVKTLQRIKPPKATSH